jgi:hypothetical protein
MRVLRNGWREYGFLYKQFSALKSSDFVYTVAAMPHGNPKKFTAFRIDPELLDAVRALTTNVTAAVEEGLRWWLVRAQRRQRGKTRSKATDSRKGAA